MSSKCIFCYTDILQCSPKNPSDIKATPSSLFLEDSLEPEIQGQIQQNDLLSKHLDVIFILRNIFKIPSTRLSSYLKSCPDIEHWITTCQKCDKVVKRYTTIYLKCQDVKSTLIKLVKDTFGKDNEDIGMILDITDECRRFIVKQDSPISPNPFIEGDLMALQLVKSGRHQVSSSPTSMEIDYNDDNNNHDDDTFQNISKDDEKPKKPKKKRIRSRKLKCPEPNCPSEFDRRPELNLHLIEAHNKDPKPPKPDLHQRKYPNEYYVYSENRKVPFLARFPSKCDLCSKEFVSQEGLATHLKQMEQLLTKKMKYHCKICGNGISNRLSTLRKHEARCPSSRTSPSIKNRTFTCPVEDCRIIFTQYISLETHYRHHHRTLEQQPCTVENCQEKFYTEGGLEYHLKDKHKEAKAFKCNHCGKGFPSKCQLESHKKMVLEREKFEKDPLASTTAVICNYCGKSFLNEGSLRGHVGRVHENTLKTPCEHCGLGIDVGNKERMNIHLWKVHQRRDVPLRWKCEVEGCGRICYTGRQLELHMTRHRGTPQFCCEEFGKEFYNKHHLKEHVMAMHESRRGGEMVKCEICGMEFEYWKYMIRHRRTVHENKKRRPKKKDELLEWEGFKPEVDQDQVYAQENELK